MTRSHRREIELGDAELEILKALWETGPATVRAVMNRLHETSGRELAYTTVQTTLTRLEKKGCVTSRKAADSGQAHVFRAKVSRERISQSRLRALLEQLYDGSAAPLVVQLMETERFTPDEIAQLQSLIERLDDVAANKKKGKSG